MTTNKPRVESYINPELKAQVKELAALQGITVSKLIEQLLIEYCEEYKMIKVSGGMGEVNGKIISLSDQPDLYRKAQVNLRARTAKYCCVDVYIPAEAGFDDDQLRQLYDCADELEFMDDEEYWERGDLSIDETPEDKMREPLNFWLLNSKDPISYIYDPSEGGSFEIHNRSNEDIYLPDLEYGRWYKLSERKPDINDKGLLVLWCPAELVISAGFDSKGNVMFRHPVEKVFYCLADYQEEDLDFGKDYQWARLKAL